MDLRWWEVKEDEERVEIGTTLSTVMISADELLPWLKVFLVSGPDYQMNAYWQQVENIVKQLVSEYFWTCC